MHYHGEVVHCVVQYHDIRKAFFVVVSNTVNIQIPENMTLKGNS